MVILRRILFVTVFSLILSGCSHNGLRIGNSVNLCCPGDYDNYRSFSLETENMPLFLRDYMVAEFTTAFESRGLTRNDQTHDLDVVLSYRHVNLDANQQNIDPFIRQESIDVELHYIATIDIEMKEATSGRKVWAGQIHRIHRVSPGEYMHEHRATVAFRETFIDLLENYPSRLSN